MTFHMIKWPSQSPELNPKFGTWKLKFSSFCIQYNIQQFEKKEDFVKILASNSRYAELVEFVIVLYIKLGGKYR